jgi:hypothetical protein
VYGSHNYTAGKASIYENKPIKIKTTDGKKYKLSWIKKKDGNVFGIKNSKVENIKKDEIKAIIINNSNYFTTFDEPINSKGNILMVTKDPKHRGKFWWNCRCNFWICLWCDVSY